MTEFKNELSAKVTQYTYIRNGRRLRINRYEYVAGYETWEIIDGPFCIARLKNGLEVKNFLGARPTLQGAYEIYDTPVGRSIEKQLYGTRVL